MPDDFSLLEWLNSHALTTTKLQDQHGYIQEIRVAIAVPKPLGHVRDIVLEAMIQAKYWTREPSAKGNSMDNYFERWLPTAKENV